MSLAVIGVDGPTSSTDGQAAVFDGTTGKKIKSAGFAPREVLTGNRTYYVRTDGSDSNTGLANTSGGAFLTWQKAYDVIAGTLDLSGYDITVQVGDGTYTGQFNVNSPWTGAGNVTFHGNSGTPSNVLLSTTSLNHCVGVFCACPGTLTVSGFKLQTTTSGHGLLVSNFARLTFSNIDFGGLATNYHHIATEAGGYVTASGDYAISGNPSCHLRCFMGGIIDIRGKTITLSGTPSWGNSFANAEQIGSMFLQSNTYSGAATGKRYVSTLNSVINTFGAGASALPGDSAGSTATGGQYT